MIPFQTTIAPESFYQPLLFNLKPNIIVIEPKAKNLLGNQKAKKKRPNFQSSGLEEVLYMLRHVIPNRAQKKKKTNCPSDNNKLDNQLRNETPIEDSWEANVRMSSLRQFSGSILVA